MHRSIRALSLALAGTLAVFGARSAQAQKIKGSAALKARAKVSSDSAKKVALAQVPNGKVRSGEIEDEKGKLIYSFDIAVAGKSGVEEVNVDALTGAVVSHEHESAKAERAEAKAEKAMKPATKKTP